MAFIGNTNTTQAFAPAIDYFNGNGSTTAFTLSRPVASVAQVQVVINNVPQNPSDAYTVSGNTITFTSAPSSGTSNIYVYYTSPVTQVVQPSVGTIAKLQLDIANLNGTGALQLPTGTTAQRPTGATGLIRQNSTTGNPEWYDATTSSWLQFSQPAGYSVNYLVVAGGGGGGRYAGGGGGGGGSLISTISLSSGTAYAITIGSGGAGSTSNASNGSPGTNSTFASFATAIGGGGGGTASTSGTGGGAGGSGGCGGGGGGQRGDSCVGGTATTGQGYAGGNNFTSPNYGSGGGGGGGGVGANGTSTTSGAGGIGIASTISGTSTYYAGGGGGGASSSGTSAASGGTGGGGNGGANLVVGAAGGTNTGGGGGGGGGDNTSGGNGGSGVVIISYLGSQRGTGGTITSSGGYTIHTFTSSGTYNA